MQGEGRLDVNGGTKWSRLLTVDSPLPSSSSSSNLEHIDNEIGDVGEAGNMGMESLDYEVVESLAYREDQAGIHLFTPPPFCPSSSSPQGGLHVCLCLCVTMLDQNCIIHNFIFQLAEEFLQSMKLPKIQS
jgi:hypothetical protein